MMQPQSISSIEQLMANGSAKIPKREYGPAPAHLLEAIRIELKKIVDAPDLESRLGDLGRLANQADDLITLLRAPDVVMLGEHKMLNPGAIGVMPNNAETYGAQMMRQIVAAVQEYQKSSKETPENLAEALAVARREGMPDVAAELEKKLLGKTLEGNKPIDKASTVQDYLDKVDRPQATEPPPPAVNSLDYKPF